MREPHAVHALGIAPEWHDLPVQDDGRYAKLVRALEAVELPGISFSLPGSLPTLSLLAILNPLSRCTASCPEQPGPGIPASQHPP